MDELEQDIERSLSKAFENVGVSIWVDSYADDCEMENKPPKTDVLFDFTQFNERSIKKCLSNCMIKIKNLEYLNKYELISILLSMYDLSNLNVTSGLISHLILSRRILYKSYKSIESLINANEKYKDIILGLNSIRLGECLSLTFPDLYFEHAAADYQGHEKIIRQSYDNLSRFKSSQNIIILGSLNEDIKLYSRIFNTYCMLSNYAFNEMLSTNFNHVINLIHLLGTTVSDTNTNSHIFHSKIKFKFLKPDMVLKDTKIIRSPSVKNIAIDFNNNDAKSYVPKFLLEIYRTFYLYQDEKPHLLPDSISSFIKLNKLFGSLRKDIIEYENKNESKEKNPKINPNKVIDLQRIFQQLFFTEVTIKKIIKISFAIINLYLLQLDYINTVDEDINCVDETGFTKEDLYFDLSKDDENILILICCLLNVTRESLIVTMLHDHKQIKPNHKVRKSHLRIFMDKDNHFIVNADNAVQTKNNLINLLYNGLVVLIYNQFNYILNLEGSTGRMHTFSPNNDYLDINLINVDTEDKLYDEIIDEILAEDTSKFKKHKSISYDSDEILEFIKHFSRSKIMRFADENSSFCTTNEFSESLLDDMMRNYKGLFRSYSDEFKPIKSILCLPFKSGKSNINKDEVHTNYNNHIKELISKYTNWIFLPINLKDSENKHHVLDIMLSAPKLFFSIKYKLQDFEKKYVDSISKYFNTTKNDFRSKHTITCGKKISWFLDYIILLNNEVIEYKDKMYRITPTHVYLSQKLEVLLINYDKGRKNEIHYDYDQYKYYQEDVYNLIFNAISSTNPHFREETLFIDLDRKPSYINFNHKEMFKSQVNQLDNKNYEIVLYDYTKFQGYGNEPLPDRKSYARFILLKFWNFFMFLANTFIPNWTINWTLNIKSLNDQHLWRERLVAFLVVFLINTFFIFWITTFRKISCKTDGNSNIANLLDTRRLWWKHERIYMYGEIYDFNKIKRLNGHQNTLPTNMNGKDVSTVFRRDLAWDVYCPNIVKPAGFSLYPYVDNDNIVNIANTTHEKSSYEIYDWNYNHDESISTHLRHYHVGSILWDSNAVEIKLQTHQLQTNYQGAIISVNNSLYDISSLFYPTDGPRIKMFPEPIDSYLLSRDWEIYNVKINDLTSYFNSLENRQDVYDTITCLDGLFKVGIKTSSISPMCIMPNIILCLYTGVLLLPLLTRLIISLILYFKNINSEKKRRRQFLQWENDRLYFGSPNSSNININIIRGSKYGDNGTDIMKEYRRTLDIPTISSFQSILFPNNQSDKSLYSNNTISGRLTNVIILLQFYLDKPEEVFRALNSINSQIVAPNENFILLIICDGRNPNKGIQSSGDSVREYFQYNDIDSDENEFLYESLMHPIHKLNRCSINILNKNVSKIFAFPVILIEKLGWIDETDWGNRGIRDSHHIILGFLHKVNLCFSNLMSFSEFNRMDNRLINCFSIGNCLIDDYEYILFNDSRFNLYPFATSEMAKYLSQNENVLGVTGRVNVANISILHLWDLYSIYYLDKVFESANGQVTNLETGFSMFRLFKKPYLQKSCNSCNSKINSNLMKNKNKRTSLENLYTYICTNYDTCEECNQIRSTKIKILLHPGVLNDYFKDKQYSLHWKTLLNSKYSGYLTLVLLRRFNDMKTSMIITAEAQYSESLSWKTVYFRQIHYYNTLMHGFLYSLNFPFESKLKSLAKFPVRSRMALRSWSPAIIICTYYLLGNAILGNDNLEVTFPFLVVIMIFILLYTAILGMQKQWRIMLAFAFHTIALCPMFMIFFPFCSWISSGVTLDSHDTVLNYGTY